MLASSPFVEIEPNFTTYAVTFAENGEYLVSGDTEGVQLWQVKNGRRMIRLKAEPDAMRLAVSKDGRWIAAGTFSGVVLVWDAKTYQKVFSRRQSKFINGLDFSPDSTRLVTASDDFTASVWDIATGERVLGPLRHEHYMITPKYSPQGDRIAIATEDSIRVYDSNDGRLLVEIPGGVYPWYNSGLLWSHDKLFTLCNNAIRRVDTSTGSVVAEWPVPGNTKNLSSIALPQSEKFIAYCTERTVMFWDTSTHAQLGLIERTDRISEIAFSSCGRFFAIGEGRRISIHSLSHVTDPAPLPRLPTIETTPTFQKPSHHILASRALIRTRLRQWDAAIVDAEQSINIQPSLIGYLAISLAMVGKGEKEKGYRMCDIAFAHFHSTHFSFLLIKAVIIFIAGEHINAISRMDDLIGMAPLNSVCHAVQAYMYLLHGRSQMENSDYDGAIKSFEHAGSRAQHYRGRHPLVISLVNIWMEVRSSRNYHSATSLNPDAPQSLFIKRSKAQRAKGSWDDALADANEAIARDPSSPWGYEAKHAVLYGTKHYIDGMDAFETMLSKMEQSPDPAIRELRGQYISPSSTRTKIRRVVHQTTHHLPRVLINTYTGRLLNKAEQLSTFESSPVFNELLSSMTTRIDRGRIKREVREYFRYVMLSHKWEENEPLFQQVIQVAVYDLDTSPTHDKLQAFCKIVRDAGFNWAWSDTCCIDKQDHFVLQEALVAMFKWYCDSALVIVFLRGVRSPAELGDLMKSVWNTRAWTFQEYIAGKVIHFYTEDWKLYLDLKIPNHKESPQIISEMEKAAGMSAGQLMGLRPGLNNIREKLCLASTRQTTLVEDAAYSLLGIFSVTGIPAIYGEGESALGRLLAHILSGSGDVSILAWTGQSSSVNSCLPARIIVYSKSSTSHLPLCIQSAEMEDTLSMLRDSAPDLDLALRLYNRLDELPTPWFTTSRMKLPCIAFKLPSFSLHQTRSGHVYRAETVAFGPVEIKTRWNLSRQKGLYLVHPWLDALLGREDVHVGAFVHDDIGEPSSPGADDEDTDDEAGDDFEPPPGPEVPLSPTPVNTVPLDKETRLLRLIAHLRQPFGPLLFMLASMGGRETYRRIAADSLITVQMQEHVSLDEVLENVRILDVL